MLPVIILMLLVTRRIKRVVTLVQLEWLSCERLVCLCTRYIVGLLVAIRLSGVGYVSEISLR